MHDGEGRKDRRHLPTERIKGRGKYNRERRDG